MKDILLAIACLVVTVLCIAAAVVQALRDHPGNAIALLLAGLTICVGVLRLAWRKLR